MMVTYICQFAGNLYYLQGNNKQTEDYTECFLCACQTVTKEVNQCLAKPPLNFNGSLANLS